MAVTPVRTGPLPTSSLPAPEMIVAWPTSTPFTSVIALLEPGVPLKGTPRSRAGGLFGAAATTARVFTARKAAAHQRVRMDMEPPAKEAVYRDVRPVGVAAFGAHRRARVQSHRVTISGEQMDSWKKAAVLASIGAGAILFMKRRYPAGVLATGVGLALLASEYPEKFEKVRRALPDYFDRGMQVMEMAAKAGQRITDAAGRSAVDAWEEIGG